MKALSIKQPWAWLIANGYKDIENRTRKTNFRGRFLIHASLAFDHDALAWLLANRQNIILPERIAYERGGIVGEANIVDCVTESFSLWFSGPFGYRIERARPLLFQPCKGMLGFFDPRGLYDEH